MLRNLSTTYVKVIWEKEARVTISDDDWLYRNERLDS